MNVVKYFHSILPSLIFRQPDEPLAPHDWETRRVLIKDEDILQNARQGDVIVIMRNVGDGGDHSLSVRNFKLTIRWTEQSSENVQFPFLDRPPKEETAI